MPKTLNFTPLQDFVLIEEIPKNETSGGIAIPMGVADPEEPDKGRVVAVGPGHTTEFGVEMKPTVKVGDIVYMFFVYTGKIPVRLGGKDYCLVKSNSIVALVAEG